MSVTPHATPTVRAWDLPTRLFHWTLVLLIVSAWVSYEFAEDLGDDTLIWHRANGLAILTLIVWRLLWGIWGSSTARFSGFVRGPAAILAYARRLVGHGAARYLGHNPLGALMVLALLATLAIQGGFGLFATDDNDLVGGPLYRLVDEAQNVRAARMHGFVFNFVLVPLALLHITVNLLYTLVKKEPLIQAMLTGRKPAEPYADASEATIAAHPLLRALVCLVAAATIVLGGILALGGRLALY
ncbi:cytochrome b/b6 domain-containing protein [Hyphomicrobium sp.]|uniref:cytochrome b/b6 domain-containing protein n=1 Tax=Hyphomicrobium sp. TaxID=82 RepID=UPI0025B96BB9|nr:cytochrome b/b6 domain-containing protein [Hyphomicrobium sp.]MCC7253089.1 cytochrome b/b6 domain-containing protein [Hyphomicrobium sp.]